MMAGLGTAEPDWGDDGVGTHEPFTVLGPGDAERAEELVVVSLTGFEGYQGDLAQASRGYLKGPEEFSIEGRRAMFTPASGDAWADLVAVAGDDLAIRVTSRGATREELVEILDQVEVPADRTRAPVVVDPPGGLEVVGAVDADAVVALGSVVEPGTDRVPGPTTAHAAGWIGEDEAKMSVVSLPGGAVDLDALAGVIAFPLYRDTTVEAITVRDRPAVLVERTEPGRWVSRAVWMHTEWGDTVVVSAVGRTVPAAAALRAVAASAQPVERSAWEAFVIKAAGGPGLHPDEGSVEIARGFAGDVEWLLQTAGPGAGLVGGTHEPVAVDPCLKLSDRRRACTTGGFSDGTDWVTFSDTGEKGMPPFVVVSTAAVASHVRITTVSDETTVPLVPVPDHPLTAAVVVVDDPGTPWCTATGDIPTDPVQTMRVEALDAEHRVVHCIGLSQEPGT